MKVSSKFVHGRGVAVVGAVGADNALVAGGLARHAQGDLVGFAAGADDEGHGQGVVMQGSEALRVFHDQFVQVAVMHVQGL